MALSITVLLPDGERRIAADKMGSVRDLLDGTDLRISAGCNGSGRCGQCRIRVIAGDAGEPTANELAVLDDSLLSQGGPLAGYHELCNGRYPDFADLFLDHLHLQPFEVI